MTSVNVSDKIILCAIRNEFEHELLMHKITKAPFYLMAWVTKAGH